MKIIHIVPVSPYDIKPSLSYGGIQVIVAKLAQYFVIFFQGLFFPEQDDLFNAYFKD